MENQSNKIAALYCRLSRGDDVQDDKYNYTISGDRAVIGMKIISAQCPVSNVKTTLCEGIVSIIFGASPSRRVRPKQKCREYFKY